ncbi:MAG TPA: EamA family transporter [Thermodesulfobacteriota bacterium]|nr:EamA family transporter [Thermodesulfobacteriota bacterium]
MNEIAMFSWGVSLFLIVPPSKVLEWFLPVFVFRLFALIMLTTFMLYTKSMFKVKFQPSSLILILSIGFLDVGAFFTYSFGVSSAYASVVAPIAGTFTMVTILLAKIFLKEKIVPNQAIGIIGIIAGLGLISFTPT